MSTATTERLRIEVLSPAHAGVLFAPLAAAALYDYIDDAPYPTVDALAARFAQLASGGGDAEAWHNWVAFARDSGTPVATLQATRFADGHALVAYAVMPDHWRRGIATEAVTWLLGWLRAAGATRAEALTDTRNRASIALIEKLGFARVATDSHSHQRRLTAQRRSAKRAWALGGHGPTRATGPMNSRTAARAPIGEALALAETLAIWRHPTAR